MLNSPDHPRSIHSSTIPDRNMTSNQLTPDTAAHSVTKTFNNIEVTSPSDSVASMASSVTLTSPTTSHELVASPTTASASPMSEEVVSVAIPIVQKDPETLLASLSAKSG